MTNHADRFGFMQAGKPPVTISVRTHFLLGAGHATYVLAYVFWRDWILNVAWTPFGILLTGFAIISLFKAVFHLGNAMLQYFGKKYPKSFYSVAMLVFWAVMYAQWVADTGAIAETGTHGRGFFAIMGVLLVMEYLLAKELSKAVSKTKNDE